MASQFIQKNYDIMFRQQYQSGLKVVIRDVLPHLRHFRPSNHLKLSKGVFFFKRGVYVDFTSSSFCEVIDLFQLNNQFW